VLKLKLNLKDVFWQKWDEHLPNFTAWRNAGAHSRQLCWTLFSEVFFYSRGSNSIKFYSEHLAKEADSAFSGGSNVQRTAAGLREYEEN